MSNKTSPTKEKKSTPPARRKKKGDSAFAIHATTDNGHVVGIGNLRVLLTNEDGVWFAHGLEIDYAAQGDSIDDVQLRFEQGLEGTIREHLRVFGGLENLLVPAPQAIWRKLYSRRPEAPSSVSKRHTQVSLHPIFETVAYFMPQAA